MYYVKVQWEKIVSKGYKSTDILNQEEGTDIVTEDIYNQITRLPADFVKDDTGRIVEVTPAPEPEPVPEPPTPEERLAAVEEALLLLLMEV